MSRRNILLCALLIFMTVFNSNAFATQPPPYASIVAYNANWDTGNRANNGSRPEFSTLGVLDVINMTPWNISLGSAPGTPLFSGNPGIAYFGNQGTYSAWEGQWLAGFNFNSNIWKPKNSLSNTTTGFGGNFAYHSIQVALNNLNNVWELKNTNTKSYVKPLYWDTIPIVVNDPPLADTSNTANLTFAVTSAQSFTGLAKNNTPFPATALSFGDGTNNYGWENFNISGANYDNGGGYNSATHFLTVTGSGTNANTWQPITKNLGGVTANKGTGGLVQSPNLITVAGLIYPKFSTDAQTNIAFDLVVILQAGGYGDMQLLFLAIPNSNDAFLPTASTVIR